MSASSIPSDVSCFASLLMGKEASPHFMLHRILCSIYIRIVVLFVRTRVHSDN